MRSAIKLLLKGLGWALIMAGGLSFLIGGGALHEFYGVDRIVAEAYGLVATPFLLLAGFGLRYFAERP